MLEAGLKDRATTADCYLRRPPAVDDERRAGHVGGRARGEKHNRAVVVVLAAMRPSGVRFSYSATNSGAWPASLHAAGHQRVDADAERRAVLGQPAREVQHARLRDAVADRLVVLRAVAAPVLVHRLVRRHDAVGRRHVDDAARLVEAVLAARNWAMNDCDTTSALFRCESSIASHADSGYCSKRPVSSAASAGEAPRPALLTRIVAVPKRCPDVARAPRRPQRDW